MKKLIIALTAILSLNSYASSGDYIYEEYGQLYEDIGYDNNYFDRYIFKGQDFEDEFRKEFPYSSFTATFDMKETLESCLFYSAGAYGEHLTELAQAALVEKLLGLIEWEKQIYGELKFYRVDDFDFEWLTGECALLVVDGNSAQIIQGVGMD